MSNDQVGTRGNNTKEVNLRRLSHGLTWALRHAAPKLGLTMSPDGFVPVDELVSCTHSKLRGCNLEDVQKIVKSCNKQRFKLQQCPAHVFGRRSSADEQDELVWCIRANQGHSIEGINPDLLLTQLTPEELSEMTVIVHGTYRDAWKMILETQGLKRMARNHIHFAAGLPGESGVISGMRRSCEVYIYINAKKCAEDGVIFYRSDNGVLLTSGLDESGTLPVSYFSYVEDSKGEILLDQR